MCKGFIASEACFELIIYHIYSNSIDLCEWVASMYNSVKSNFDYFATDYDAKWFNK